MLKISIIVPAYNAEKFLQECIESLINQTYKNIEIIIIDDKSSDNTIEIMKSYEKIDKRIICLYNENNLGANITRTIGIRKCLGDYIMFVDADDYIAPETIEQLVCRINNNQVDIIKFNYLNTEKIIDKEETYDKNNKEIFYKDVLSFAKYNNLSNEIINKKLINLNKEVFNIKSSIGEDLQVNLELFDKAKKILLIPDKYYYYRINNNSTTNTENIDRILNTINEIKYIFWSLIKYAKQWNLLTKETEKMIVLREVKGILDNIIKILNSRSLKDEDYNKIKNIIDNNEIIQQVHKQDIMEIKTNFLNKRIYMCIFKKNFIRAKIWIDIKRIIKKFI